MQIEEDSYSGEVKFAKCELCGMIFNFLPANHKCMQPKSIAEVGKLFDEKFTQPNPGWRETGYTGNTILNDNAYPNQIKQFWLEHFKSLLEEMRMEDTIIIGTTKYSKAKREGYNTRNAEINKHLDNLLSKGEVK